MYFIDESAREKYVGDVDHVIATNKKCPRRNIVHKKYGFSTHSEDNVNSLLKHFREIENFLTIRTVFLIS